MPSIVFDPFAPQGQQYAIVGAVRDAIAVLIARGVEQHDAEKRVDTCRLAATKAGQAMPVQIPPHKQRGDAIVEAFLFDRYTIDPNGRVLFSRVYDAFLATMPPVDRRLWSRKRFSLRPAA